MPYLNDQDPAPRKYVFCEDNYQIMMRSKTHQGGVLHRASRRRVVRPQRGSARVVEQVEHPPTTPPSKTRCSRTCWPGWRRATTTTPATNANATNTTPCAGPPKPTRTCTGANPTPNPEPWIYSQTSASLGYGVIERAWDDILPKLKAIAVAPFFSARVFLRRAIKTATPPIPGADSSASESALPAVYSYLVVNTYLHDPNAFTQGLVFEDGIFYEGTGQYGASGIRKVAPATGEVLAEKTPIRAVFWRGYRGFWRPVVPTHLEGGDMFCVRQEHVCLADPIFLSHRGMGADARRGKVADERWHEYHLFSASGHVSRNGPHRSDRHRGAGALSQ